MAKKIDFAAINAAALGRFDSLVREWLPGGERSGSEYRVLNPLRHDNKKGSFSISLTKGVWMDFATDDRGSDPISLFAYLFHNNDQGAAAKDLADILGIEGKKPTRGPEVKAFKQAEKAGAVDAVKPGNDSPWQPIIPVPDDAPDRHVAHPVRGKPETVWTYRGLSGELLGYVFRFRKSDGEKEICPLTYCRHSESGVFDWRWKQWTVPRPLYGLERLTVADVDDAHHKATVLIVEGEKCADAAAVALPELAVLTWSGGGKAIEKADWSVLAGRKVIIWPDCDSQREKMPKDAPDGFVPEYMPEDKQPGIVAARKVATGLHALGCKVWVMKTPDIGSKCNGWDVADAIAEGMTGETLEQYVRQQSVWFEGETAASVDPARESKQLSTPETVCTGGGGSGDVPRVVDDWQLSLKQRTRGGIEPCMANIAKILRHHPAWVGVIGLNDFSKEIEKLKPTPWGSVGPWQNIDDLRLSEWLADIDITIKATSMISEAVSLAADDNKYHPVREWLDQLPAWDGTPRLTCYLADITGSASTPYLELAGRWFIMAMVARIYQPGVKFDYALVLEGAQGQGKSSFFRVLADPWFSETSFEIGSNEGVMSIQGTWLHEMAEMGQMARAEDTAFKSFLAYQKDKFRRPYDRRPQDVPRVCLFGGTTNLDQYFKDHTGNRRIWPVRCDYVDTALLTEIREQLFAEAIVAFKAGERFWPTREEEKIYFEPEQEARMPVDGWEELIARFVYDPENRLRNFFTAPVLLMEACKVEKSKIDEGNRMTARVGRIMKRLGWERDREPSGRYRSYGYVRPEDQRVLNDVFGSLPDEY